MLIFEKSGECYTILYYPIYTVGEVGGAGN